MRCTTEVSTSVPTSTRRCARKIRIPSSPPRILSATARRWRWSPPVPKMPMHFFLRGGAGIGTGRCTLETSQNLSSRIFFLIREDAIAFQEDDIMLGIKFSSFIFARQEEKSPLVILLGLGTNTGSHSGTSPLGLYLNSLSRASGQILVAAGGNETGARAPFFAVYFLLPPPMRMWNCGSVPANGDLRWNCGRVNRSFTVSDFYAPSGRRNGTHPALRRRRTPDSLSSGRNEHSPQLYQLRAGDRKRTDPDAL